MISQSVIKFRDSNLGFWSIVTDQVPEAYRVLMRRYRLRGTPKNKTGADTCAGLKGLCQPVGTSRQPV